MSITIVGKWNFNSASKLPWYKRNPLDPWFVAEHSNIINKIYSFAQRTFSVIE